MNRSFSIFVVMAAIVCALLVGNVRYTKLNIASVHVQHPTKLVSWAPDPSGERVIVKVVDITNGRLACAPQLSGEENVCNAQYSVRVETFAKTGFQASYACVLDASVFRKDGSREHIRKVPASGNLSSTKEVLETEIGFTLNVTKPDTVARVELDYVTCDLADLKNGAAAQGGPETPSKS